MQCLGQSLPWNWQQCCWQKDHLYQQDIGICHRFLVWKTSGPIFIICPWDIYWALHPLTFKCEMRYRLWERILPQDAASLFIPSYRNKKKHQVHIRLAQILLLVLRPGGHRMLYSYLNVSLFWTNLNEFVNFLLFFYPQKPRQHISSSFFKFPFCAGREIWKSEPPPG